MLPSEGGLPEPVRVFVSSTYRNLASYRETLRLALQKSGLAFLGMEHFAAQDAPPFETCFEELDQADVYLGVIGNTYGSSPAGHDLSYTELEYVHARDRRIPCIILVISDDANVRVGDIDLDPARNDRLRDFRARLLQAHTVDRFTDEGQAAWMALAALRRLETRLREEALAGARP